MATTEAGISMQRLADYYGFGVVSYANMVRDLVYEDTRETNPTRIQEKLIFHPIIGTKMSQLPSDPSLYQSNEKRNPSLRWTPYYNILYDYVLFHGPHKHPL